MISKNWKEFIKNINIKDKDVSIYEDNEGNYAILPTANLLCGVQYNELTEQQLQVAIFEQKIPKNMKLETKEIKKIISKKDITGKDEDKYTLVESDKTEKAYIVWFLIDGLKNMQPFTNKAEALKVAKDHNEKVLRACHE